MQCLEVVEIKEEELAKETEKESSVRRKWGEENQERVVWGNPNGKSAGRSDQLCRALLIGQV